LIDGEIERVLATSSTNDGGDPSLSAIIKYQEYAADGGRNSRSPAPINFGVSKSRADAVVVVSFADRQQRLGALSR